MERLELGTASEDTSLPLGTVRHALMLLGLLAAGCAGQGPGPQLAASATPNSGSATVDTGSAYQLTKEELGFNCQKLRGHMKVRIMQVRSTQSRRPTSAISRGLQSVTTPIAGGTRYGANPRADLARDRAKLEAFNRQLARKGCKTLDLNAELAATR